MASWTQWKTLDDVLDARILIWAKINRQNDLKTIESLYLRNRLSDQKLHKTLSKIEKLLLPSYSVPSSTENIVYNSPMGD